LGPLGTVATNRPTVPAPGDYDDGEIGGMMIGRGNRSTRRKSAPVPLCPPQNPHAGRTRTRAVAVGSQRLTAELRHGPVHALDRSATVIGLENYCVLENVKYFRYFKHVYLNGYFIIIKKNAEKY
jgi:hypothetical protein